MGTACGRILFENWSLLDATVVTVSSEQVQAPKTFLDDPLRSKRWRTKLGWNIVAGYNDKIDFGDPALHTATLTPGLYDGITLAAEIQTQINLVAAAPTFTFTYSPITNLFTVIETTGFLPYTFFWLTGPNAGLNPVLDLGYGPPIADAGPFGGVGVPVPYTSTFPTHHGTAWIKFDLGTGFASFPVSALLAFDGNFKSATSITVQANITDSWVTPALSIPLQMDSANDYVKGIEWITSTTAYRWWRVLINDVQNTDGFTEMGVPYIGDYYEPSNGYSAAFTENREELSSVDIAEEGASFQHVRSTRMAYPLQWLGIPTAEKPRWDSFADLVQVGRPFFLAFEPIVDIQKTLYMMLERPMQSVFQAPSHWRFTTNVIEVLR